MPAEFAITAVDWDRVHLTLTAEFDPAPATAPSFAIDNTLRILPVDSESLGDGRYRLAINVTNFRDRKQVPDGTYRIVTLAPDTRGPLDPLDAEALAVPVTDDGRVADLSATFDIARLVDLEPASRAFLYAGNKTSYTVTFGITEDDTPELLMRVYQMFRNPKPAADAVKPPALERIKESAKKKLLPRSRRVTVANKVYELARRFNPPTGNRILFASEMRERMEGNLLRVHDRLVERGLAKNYEIRTAFRVPQAITKQGTLRLIYLLATSDIVIIDDYFGILGSLQLSPDTKIIQAWHAGSGFKAIGYSRFGNYGSPTLQNAHRKYTYAITGSQHLVPVYAEAFGIEESAVIPTGLPRIDTFLDPERTKRVVADFYRTYPQLEGKRTILFAPTFRGRGALDAYYDYDRIDFAKLYEMCGEDSVVLFRMHHFVHEPVPIPPEYADRFFDFGAFPDGNDLLQVTDILVTDYSSIIYEYSLLDRPMLFFAYDKDIYAATRGFHRDFDATAPGKVCATTDELIKAIQTEDFEMWKIEEFRRDNFDRVDTHSADRFIDWLILDDPHTSRAAASGSAQRGPSEDGAGNDDTGLTDQTDA
jgi:CDP-ribitol ribitolphosphotransferase